MVQEFEVKGGKVTVPVGCNGLEDWLLDNVDVQKLLPLLRQGMLRKSSDSTCMHLLPSCVLD